MLVVQNLAKKVMILSQDGHHAHIIGNSVSGERYRTTMVLLSLTCLEENELHAMSKVGRRKSSSYLLLIQDETTLI